MKYMDINEFADSGLLFHINRTVLHPLGLALEITVEDDGSARLSGIWDCRDDPEGIAYDEDLLKECMAKYRKYMSERGEHSLASREQRLGFTVQK